MPRNVIYFGGGADNGNLADIVNLPYTDVIVCFASVDGNLNVYGNGAAFDGNLQSNIRALQNVGKKVLVSFGGSSDVISSSGWNFCAQNVRTLVNSISMFVRNNGFDGVDIDYEDNSGFDGTGGYDGVQFLVQLTSGLAQALPTGHNIITHAPQTAYWDASGNQFQWVPIGGRAPYAQIWYEVGDQITWINNQFYSTPYYDKDDLTKSYWYEVVRTFTGLEKLLMGVLLSGGEGAISLDDMAQNVIPALLSAYGSQFGGVMGWQFAFDQDGNWARGIAQALGLTPPVPGPNPEPSPGPTSGSWNVNDLTAATNAQLAAGNPNGYVFTANGASGMHVVYRGIDGHIYELWWQDGWNVNDLTAATNAPAAAGNPNGYMFTANGVSGMHVVYRGADNHIHELYWQDGDWNVNDLTIATNAPAAAGDPNGYVFTANGVSGMHVVYRGFDDDIHELYWQNGDWSVNDLTAATNAPAAAGDPNGYVFTVNGVSGMHIVYRGFDDDIHELYWQNGDWSVNDLTATTNAPAAAGDPNGYVFTANGVSGMHVVYRGADDDIHELYWQNGDWSLNDLTAATNAPAAAGDPDGYAFTANGVSGMHVVYLGADNDIHELYWENGWNVNDLTAATNAPAAAGNPNGYMFTANGVSGMHVVYPSADGHIQEFWWAPA